MIPVVLALLGANMALLFIGCGIQQVVAEMRLLRRCHEDAAYQNRIVSEEMLILQQGRKQ